MFRTTYFFQSLAIIFALLITSGIAQQNRSTGDRVIEVDNFHSIQIQGVGYVKLLQGNKPEVRLSDHEGPSPEVQVRNGVLRINSKSGKKATEHNVTIVCTNLKLLSTQGAIHIETGETLDLDRLKLHFQGATTADLQLKVGTLTGDITGATTLNMSGKAQEMSFEVSGASNIEAADLMIQSAELRVSGMGSVAVHAQKELDVDISGMAHVVYGGNPSISKHISGMASLESIGNR
ncbi:MAG: head GIN domain-containing protein [Bacteroidota bacterium]